MAKVILSDSAAQDIDDILANVYDFTGFISTPQKLLTELNKTFDLIAFMPDAVGRLREDGDREAFCRAYRIVYQKQGDDILIITVIHSSRIYPRPE
ncbi:type II toxin-antitoxin system RelE/ParE family toxin [Rodentibacter trehalosifermentans]|uniref:type II toxin-antitoxin system RelE/ParE family toxin n=1 Tax=Rodentibacter trehalosifermentans TaxID=1908263 RepID=UPI000986644B|nr:type II toxin-antitoxin system RelE/ParE family toxin [Rodentibacter trehalosifermentans]OOF53123.1 plasmid stabilization system protein [Rodentibacter trehalosifermentans]